MTIEQAIANLQDAVNAATGSRRATLQASLDVVKAKLGLTVRIVKTIERPELD